MDKTLFENTFKDLYYCYHTAMNMDCEQYEALSELERYYLVEMVSLCKDFLKETEWVLEDA